MNARNSQPAPSRQTISYSFLRIHTGSDLSKRRLPVMSARAGQAGPVVWLTGCAHGDEVGGMVVIQEIFKRLRKSPLLQGELKAFPLMNPLGFELSQRHVAVGGEDLNRSYPGNPQGTPAQRMAHTIFSTITQDRPALVLDLHNDWRGSIPYTVLDPPPGPAHRRTYSLARNLARKTGFVLVEEPKGSPDAAFSHNTLSGSLLQRDIPAITLELGEAYVVNEINVTYGVNAVWSVLADLGLTSPTQPEFQYPLPLSYRRKFLIYSDQLVSSNSGILRFLVQPGETVATGQPVARVYNAFGKLLETIWAPHEGIVLGHSDSSVAFPGVPVVAFGLLGQNKTDSR